MYRIPIEIETPPISTGFDCRYIKCYAVVDYLQPDTVIYHLETRNGRQLDYLGELLTETDDQYVYDEAVKCYREEYAEGMASIRSQNKREPLI